MSQHKEGQYSLFPKSSGLKGCGGCICKKCLFGRSGRCPYGGCFDDLRAKAMPYFNAHPDEPPRTLWSNWEAEQGHWCRGGITYHAAACDNFVVYEESVIQECLKALIQVFQDGYMRCGIIDFIGCEQCYKEFLEREA